MQHLSLSNSNVLAYEGGRVAFRADAGDPRYLAVACLVPRIGLGPAIDAVRRGGARGIALRDGRVWPLSDPAGDVLLVTEQATFGDIAAVPDRGTAQQRFLQGHDGWLALALPGLLLARPLGSDACPNRAGEAGLPWTSYIAGGQLRSVARPVCRLCPHSLDGVLDHCSRPGDGLPKEPRLPPVSRTLVWIPGWPA